MSEDIVIRAKNVIKTYRLYNNRVDRVKETFHPFRKKYHHPFNALNGVSFVVKKGECIGIIGRNGGGKSTLLQIICGILQPSSGSIEVNEKIAAILELGAGFNPEYTGRQNVYLNASILGLTNEEIDAKFDDIISFADIGEFIDQPIKIYSSGMIMRLAFAVAVNVYAEILIIDEALSVGDVQFQSKCFNKFEEFRENNKTIIFVSHDVNTVARLCDRCILLENGKVFEAGDPNHVAKIYQKLMFSAESKKHSSDKESQQGINQDSMEELASESHIEAKLNRDCMRYGNKTAAFVDFGIQDEHGNLLNIIEASQSYTLFCKIHFNTYLDNLTVGVRIRSPKGFDVFAANTSYHGIRIPPADKGANLEVKFKIDAHLGPNQYFVTFGVRQLSEEYFVDRCIDAFYFTVIADKSADPACLANLNEKITIGFHDH